MDAHEVLGGSRVRKEAQGQLRGITKDNFIEELGCLVLCQELVSIANFNFFHQVYLILKNYGSTLHYEK